MLKSNSKTFKLKLLFRYDVILAPELMNTDVENFETIHELLDAALAQNGIM